jgi:hypothetical protein
MFFCGDSQPYSRSSRVITRRIAPRFILPFCGGARASVSFTAPGYGGFARFAAIRRASSLPVPLLRQWS